MYADFTDPQYNSSVWIDGGTKFQSGFYIDAWVNYIQPANNTRSWKPWDMYYIAPASPSVNWAGECDGSVRYVTYRINSIPDVTWSDVNQYLDATIDDFSSAMHHWQIWVSPSTPYGARNSVFHVMLDGRVVANRVNMISSAAGDPGYWKQLALGFYMSHDNNQSGCVSHVGDGAMYWDDIYIDNTRARVELGNAATYAASTHREIQIPSAWSSSQITVTSNTGTFSPGQSVYLFVVDANGSASAGFPVTIGGKSDSTAPAAPAALRMQ